MSTLTHGGEAFVFVVITVNDLVENVGQSLFDHEIISVIHAFIFNVNKVHSLVFGTRQVGMVEILESVVCVTKKTVHFLFLHTNSFSPITSTVCSV